MPIQKTSEKLLLLTGKKRSKALQCHKLVFLCLAFLLSAVIIPIVFSETDDAIKDDPDYQAQLITVSNIRLLRTAAEAYRIDQGKPVKHLTTLIKDERYLAQSDFVKKSIHDGWGRELYYYSNGETYVFMSFGRNGTPDPQISCGGCPTKTRDFDADIVWIDNHWAQSPLGIDQ